MKIAIDLTPLYGRRWTGVEMYAVELYKALLQTKHTIIPIFNTENGIDNNEGAVIVKANNRFLLENHALSQAVRRINPDVTVFPIFPPPVDLYIHRPSKLVPVIHDTAFKAFRSTLNASAKYYLVPKMDLAMKMADYIVTVSETSKKQLKKLTNRPIFNWGENISSDFKKENLNIDRSVLAKWNLEAEGYYISVSTIEPRKNLKYLLKVIRPALMKQHRKLVLVGRKGWGGDVELNTLLEEMKDWVIFTEYVELGALQSLYHFAYAFALLSLDEGFGRTPLEAITCGCKRIILSDIEIFHETLEECGNYLPLDDIEKCQKTFIANSWVEVDADFQVPFDVMETMIEFL